MADDLSSENMLDDLFATKTNDFTNRTTAYHPFLLALRGSEVEDFKFCQ